MTENRTLPLRVIILITVGILGILFKVIEASTDANFKEEAEKVVKEIEEIQSEELPQEKTHEHQ